MSLRWPTAFLFIAAWFLFLAAAPGRRNPIAVITAIRLFMAIRSCSRPRDLWSVSLDRGEAHSLTTHPAEETRAAISPDGKTIAFSADYEGPQEAYTMPVNGGLPTRRTFDGGAANVVGWTPDGKVLYATTHYSTLPNTQLVSVDLNNRVQALPLSRAAQGAYDAKSGVPFFTRLARQPSYMKRYMVCGNQPESHVLE